MQIKASLESVNSMSSLNGFLIHLSKSDLPNQALVELDNLRLISRQTQVAHLLAEEEMNLT